MKKAVSLFMAAVMVVATPASVTLADENVTTDAVILSEDGGVISESEDAVSKDISSDDSVSEDAAIYIASIEDAEDPGIAVVNDTGTSGLTYVGTNNLHWVSVDPYESAELDAGSCVYVNDDYTGSLTYQWYINDEEITGATDSTYKVSSVGYYAIYSCEVSDIYGRTITLIYYVQVENHLTLTPETADFTIEPGDSVTLEAIVTADSGTFTYEWYYMDDDGETVFLSANEYTVTAAGSTLALEDIQESITYYCNVYDIYGNTCGQYYRITVDTGLSYEEDSPNSSFVYVTYGETTELSMDVFSYNINEAFADKLTFQWEKSYVEIEGETGTTFTTDAVTSNTSYQCIVSDPYGESLMFYFYVNVDTGLTGEAIWEDRYVAPNAVYELSIAELLEEQGITLKDGYTFSYTWYERVKNEEGTGTYYSEIVGQTDSVYTIDAVTADGVYECDIADAFGGKLYCYFRIYVDNQLSVQADQNSVIVGKGGSTTLSVTASAYDMEGLTYTWYYLDETGEEHVVSSSESNSVYLEDIDSSRWYYCMVEDAYGGYRSTCIYVDTDTGLAYLDSNHADGVYSYNVDYGVSLAIAANATAKPGVTLSYQWYTVDGDEVTEIEGETEATYQISSVTSNACYKCLVSDGFGGELWFEFNVSFDNKLTVTVDNNMVTVSPDNDGVTLSFTVDACDTSELTYEWYWYDEDENEITEATTSPSLTLEEISHSGYYYCWVSDQYGNKAQASFYVGVDNKLTVDYVAEQYVVSGGSVILAVEASVLSGELSYEWYDVDKELLSETGDTLTISKVTDVNGGTYYCIITDEYGNEDSAWFYVSLVEAYVLCDHENVTHTDAIAATCTKEGNIEYWYCADCKTCFSDEKLSVNMSASDVVIAATGHTAGSAWTTTKAATCTTAGMKVQTCTKCGAVVNTAAIAVTGHSYGEWTTKTEATVFVAETQVHTCSECGAAETRSYGSALTPTIKVNASSIKLKVKQSTSALKVSGLANGDSVVSWKSSNKKIVTVNSKGKITAKNKTGKATITITLASGKTKKITVTVQKAAVKTTKITVASKKVSIRKGKTYTIKPTISPITSVQKITYTSSDKKVATVNSKGKITAKKKGTATITVKSGSRSVKIKVTVK